MSTKNIGVGNGHRVTVDENGKVLYVWGSFGSFSFLDYQGTSGRLAAFIDDPIIGHFRLSVDA